MTTAERLSKIAENEQKVYEAGKKAEYDAFWDTFQQNGTRINYVFAFGAGWKAEIFKPKYSIRPINARYLIYNSVQEYIDIPDFVAFCQENNIIIDFSNCTNAEFGLYSLRTKHFGVLDFSKCTNLNYLFGAVGMSQSTETIDEFISSSTTGYTKTTFESLASLKNITFRGTIATSIYFGYSTVLTKASITSIINALSTTTRGLTVTLSKTAKEAAFTADEWSALIATKTNWTISLV